MAFDLPPIPNYSFNPGPATPTGPAEVVARKQQQQMQQDQASMQTIMQTAKAASELAQSFVDASIKRQQRNVILAYGATLGDVNKAKVMAAYPDQSAKAIIENAVPKTPTNLEGLMTQGLLHNNAGEMQKAVIGKELMTPPATPSEPTSQAKTIKYQGKVIEANYIPGKGNKNGYMTDLNGNRLDPDKIEGTQPGEAYAEIRRQYLINQMNQQLPKVMNPANWTGNSPAAAAAKIVANAQSTKILANQILNGEIPGNSQSIANLNTEAARVLSQTGVISDTMRKDLETQTGFSKFSDAVQFFTNHPTDRKAAGFVRVIRAEMERQQAFRQKTLDQTMMGNLASLAELKRAAPEDWENGLKANGIDPDEARKGHFVLLPGFINQLTGEENQQGPDLSKASVEDIVNALAKSLQRKQ